MLVSVINMELQTFQTKTALTAWFFLLAGTYFMRMWAVKKHRNYRKEFGDKYPKRNILVPFIY
jgi:hypothetical protein